MYIHQPSWGLNDCETAAENPMDLITTPQVIQVISQKKEN